MKYIGCQLSNTEFIPKADGCQLSETGDAIVLLLGEAFDLGYRPLSSDSILNLFVQAKENLCSAITGNYTLIAFDKLSRTIFAFQNALGSSVYLYFTYVSGCLFLNTSLHELIVHSGISAELNDKVVPHFLLNGFVVGSGTLLKGIGKLVPGCLLEATTEHAVQKPCKYFQDTLSAGDAASEWNDTLSDVLRVCYSAGANIALSSGFDSNYILHYGVENGNNPINAFSIGGNFKGNELPAVRKIADLYPSVNLNCADTDANTFLQFPDIVRRLEGQVYERGAFLQYELAKLVSSKGFTSLICGECANEVMNIDFRINQDSEIQPQALNAYILDSYIAAAYIIIKKSGILLNSFGIDSRYPFADQKVINLAYSLRYNNCQSKSFHIENCRSLFPDNVFSLLGNRGGSTKESSFMDSANSEILDALIRENHFYNQYGKMLFDVKFSEPLYVQRTPNYNTHVRNPFKLMKSEISARKLDMVSRESDRHDATMKAKLICLYLDLFCKIFEEGNNGIMISDFYKIY